MIDEDVAHDFRRQDVELGASDRGASLLSCKLQPGFVNERCRLQQRLLSLSPQGAAAKTLELRIHKWCELRQSRLISFMPAPK
jgi:hypothetical protein